MGAWAQSQWEWLDKGGRKVYSDLPPPSDIPDKNILKHPSGFVVTPVASPDAGQDTPSSTAAPASGAPGNGKDKELEEAKAKAEAAEAAKKKAEEQRIAKQKADNCERAKRAKTTLTSGRLMTHTNAQGEVGFMDDATREAELRRADEAIASNCK